MTSTPRTVRFGVLAYGRDGRLHREATVALLTLRAFAPADAELVVLTDQPASYRWLEQDVRITALDAATLADWRGPAQDRFRPKLAALQQLAAAGCHAVLVDTDTMAQRQLSPILDHLQEGGFLLHQREYRIAAPPRRGDRRLRHEVAGKHWRGVMAGDDTWMWNGGVIGVPAAHAAAASHALGVYDELRAASTHFALEQLAYSIVFPAYGPLRAASDCFIHYWANRAWFDRRIERFLSTALMERWSAGEAAERLRLAPIEGPLDGRPHAWQRHVRRLLRIEMDDDDADRRD